MSRSKAATQAYAMTVKGNRESAVQTAANAAPIVRDAIRRAADTVLITADIPTIDQTDAINTRLLSESDNFTRSLPAWIFQTCPDWYIIATAIKDEQTGATTGWDIKRDVESWDKNRIRALEAIRSLNFTWRKRADGSEERYIPEPCNMARLLSFVIAGNMQAVIENAPEVVSESRVTKTRAAGFAYQNAGAAQIVDSRAYAIIIAADTLSKRTKAYTKAQDAYYATFSDKAHKAYDRANDALQQAQAQFDAAWNGRHALPKDVLDILAPAAPVTAAPAAPVTADTADQDVTPVTAA